MSEEFNAKPVQATPEDANVDQSKSQQSAGEDPSQQSYDKETSQPNPDDTKPKDPTNDNPFKDKEGEGEGLHEKSSEGGQQQPQNQDGAEGDAATKPPSDLDAEGYPPQKHAGKIGYGPDYINMTGPTLGDKMTGFKETIKGKILGKPDLVQQGIDRKTGALKQKEHEEDEKNSPFGG